MKDIAYITDFWRERYLAGYIASGGSKIKFAAGGCAECRSACLRRFEEDARALNFRVVSLSAREVWLHDFTELYVAILERAGFDDCVGACADEVVRRMGFSPGDIPQGLRFAEYLAREDMLDPLTRRELRAEIHRLLLKNPKMDKNFALCAALLVGDRLGYPILEHGARDILHGWLSARKGIRVTELRKLGLSPSRINKFNARHMLRSLAEMIRAAGCAGLAVAVHDLEALCGASSLEEIRYTKLRREDAYESIRELVDAIDTLDGVMFVFGFDRRLIDDESAGLKSYQALWARLQNEVRGERLNRFADIIDMDSLPDAGGAEES